MSRRHARIVAVVTVSRSDWGHLVPVLEAIRATPDLEAQVIVAGMHLESEYGRTVDVVRDGGFTVQATVPMDETDDSPPGIARSVARGVEGFAEAYARLRPDLLLLLGDRFEMLAAGVAALPFALPVAHVHGGEETQGAMDNQIRHAITKLAHVHFASSEVHARRIAAMGEEGWRIHMVGAPGLDRIRPGELLSRAELSDRLGLPVTGRWLVVTFHPVTLEPERTAEHVTELLAALEKVSATAIITYPSADTAGRTIIRQLEDFAALHEGCRLVRSLGDRVYLSLLRHADAMVGNSSSGLIEAPSFALPVVNVGGRQRGRLRGANVIDVECRREDILRGLERALDPSFRASLEGAANPYGDGRAAPRIAEVLRTVSLDARLIQKQFAEGGRGA